MNYLAVLMGEEEGPEWVPGTPEFEASVARHEAFWEQSQSAIVGGGALHPTSEAVTIRNDGQGRLVTDGPFAELAEVIGGFYVLAADDLESVRELVRAIPDTASGHTEVWPLAEWSPASDTSGLWLALIREPAADATPPGTAEWERGAAEHREFGEWAGDAIRGGGAVYPPRAATTASVRDGELLLSDGPYTESVEVANGLYVLRAPDRDTAVSLASRIPLGERGCVELRRIVDETG